jgi:hypothetical protein
MMQLVVGKSPARNAICSQQEIFVGLMISCNNYRLALMYFTEVFNLQQSKVFKNCSVGRRF